MAIYQITDIAHSSCFSSESNKSSLIGQVFILSKKEIKRHFLSLGNGYHGTRKPIPMDLFPKDHTLKCTLTQGLYIHGIKFHKLVGSNL